jgi:Mrp family chromosome partitioning ATPase
MLQVDQFAWPAVCQRLGKKAATELDRLVDALVDAMAEGSRMVAVGSCRRGEGATTVLLATAQRLAARGYHVLMADADPADPQLAARLGLSPEAGWEAVLLGRLQLEEVVVESVADGLAVLPLCRLPAEGETGVDETGLAESIQTLRARYDMVLLDPGPLEELDSGVAPLARLIGSRLDAVALVHHGGVTPGDDLEEVKQSLADSETVQLGVVENFVPASEAKPCTSPIGN